MVAILMSTYNGEAFLRAQIDSILAQSYSGFTLIIRDDGSSDRTCDLIASYADTRIRLIRGENLGPARSFFALLEEAKDAAYVFFSDQDDVWYPDKLEVMLTEIKKCDECPAMVFSDFSMIDENGKTTHESYAGYAALQLRPGPVGVEKILAQPYAFGCASVLNRPLIQLVQSVPDGIEMHDCWISLVAAATGKLIYLPERTIAHRFHSSNATGREGQTSLTARLKRVTSGFAAQAENTALRLRQAELLLAYHDRQMLPEVRAKLTDIAAAMKSGRLALLKTLYSHGVTRQKMVNTLFFYLTVLGIKGDIR